jgi:hypothetical protein
VLRVLRNRRGRQRHQSASRPFSCTRTTPR